MQGMGDLNNHREQPTNRLAMWLGHTREIRDYDKTFKVISFGDT